MNVVDMLAFAISGVALLVVVVCLCVVVSLKHGACLSLVLLFLPLVLMFVLGCDWPVFCYIFVVMCIAWVW